MTILTIVSEYNPFHSGHLYHFKESVKLTNTDLKVAIISGNFVQRGEPAILNKWKRTEFALQAGFDLVIELPCIYAISSAENFADGAMKIATAINSDFLSFGSECGDLYTLKKLSSLISSNESEYFSLVKNKLGEGFSYPKAQELVINELFGNEFQNLCKSNNILGLEYLKSSERLHSSIVPITVKRRKNDFLSSSDIRKAIRLNDLSKIEDRHLVPDFVFNSLTGNNIVSSLKAFEKEVFYVLRTCNSDYINNIPDIPDNMITSLKKAANTTNSIENLISVLKNKSVTQARIQRILLYVLIGVTKSDVALSRNIIPYIRILGMTSQGKSLLSNISKKCDVITSVKDFENRCTDSDLLRLLEIDKRASDIYTLAYTSDSRANLDYTNKIIIKD